MKGYRSGNVAKIVAVAFSLLTTSMTLSQINSSNQIQFSEAASVRSMDRDQDGVNDELDLERNTPRGWDVDAFGVSLDVDKDGIADSIDREKKSPFGAVVDEYGVAIDQPKGSESSQTSLLEPYSIISPAGDPAALVGRDLIAELEVVLNSVNDILGGRDLLAQDLPDLVDNAAMDKYLPELSGRGIKSVKKKLLRSYKITVDRLPTTGYGELAGVSKRSAGTAKSDKVTVTAVNKAENKKEKKTQVRTIRQ